MLNLSIAMLRSILLLLLLFQAPAVSITSPQTGDTLRGQVHIEGAMDIPNFASAELDFAFASNPTDNWFIIQTFPQPKVDSPLAIWDTTSITDGDYTLRLRVVLQDGSFQDAIITALKIRNDSPEPTATSIELAQPTSQSVSSTIVSVTPTLLSFPQPTSLPSNPASLTVPLIYSTFGRGVLIALVLFIVFSFLFRFRRD
jgi:hypothetical protein